MLFHAVLTLDGNVQQLSSLLPVYQPRKIRVLSLQPNASNSNPVYVGTTDQISDSNYGFRLEAADSGVPPAPYLIGEFRDGTVSLHEIYVKGTNGEKLHVFGALYG